jgi:hypothetical protein
MLVRIILFIILFFVSYTVVNALFRALGRGSLSQDAPERRVEENCMVECCQCGTYVPESEIIRRNISGRTCEFCSKKCLNEYKADQSSKKQ